MNVCFRSGPRIWSAIKLVGNVVFFAIPEIKTTIRPLQPSCNLRHIISDRSAGLPLPIVVCSFVICWSRISGTSSWTRHYRGSSFNTVLMINFTTWTSILANVNFPRINNRTTAHYRAEERFTFTCLFYRSQRVHHGMPVPDHQKPVRATLAAEDRLGRRVRRDAARSHHRQLHRPVDRTR